MVGVLYCEKSRLDHGAVVALLNQAGIEATAISLENYTGISECALVVNLMGAYYAEELAAELAAYFKKGGSLIHLGPAPFTMNICADRHSSNRILRDFEIVDDFIPVEDGDYVVRKADSGASVKMHLSGLQSAIYHLCESGKRDAYLEHIADAYGRDGELKAAVVIRVVTFLQGNMTFFNVDLTNDMLEQPIWKEAFLQTVRKELQGTLLPDIVSSYARYCPGEDVELIVRCENKSFTSDSAARLDVLVKDGEGNVVHSFTDTMQFPYERKISFKAEKRGVYSAAARISTGDIGLRELTTGFLVASDMDLKQEQQEFKPLYIDKERSVDYCVCDGRITPILGTTYFVSDVYRECFARFNVLLCEQELKRLAADGFNTLRSGYWKHDDCLYNADGSISTAGLRALQAFFAIAARHGFTVQFALGNVMLNQWNDKLSPIHNKRMRKKSMTLVKDFAQHFNGYHNVMLDIVNEPSYSMRGAWTLGRPSYEKGELTSFRKWLANKYGNVAALRDAWGETALTIQSFEEVQLPAEELFSRGYRRTEQRRNHAYLTDFFSFARHEFSGWVKEVRETVRRFAPDMVVTMGRDETLRVPAQQDEAVANNVDMVCWHQWGMNGAVHIEHLLNRVRGEICIAQELGIYQFDDIRSGKRFDEYQRMTKMEQKLLCAQGNFIQWQAYHDPFLYELSENALGLFRADLSPSPSRDMVKELMLCEKAAAQYVHGRRDEKVKILTLYGTSYYFSVDSPLAQSGLRNHINVLYNMLHEQTNLVLEHLFDLNHASMIGSPNLMILPAMQMLTQRAWTHVLDYVKAGGVALISGVVDKNEFFQAEAKIAALDSSYQTDNLLNIETISIGNREYSLDFRPILEYADVSNVLDCGNSNGLKEYQVGHGTIIYCPYPVELSTNMEAVAALYSYAIQKAGARNDIYTDVKCNPNVLFMATAYADCAVYTLINHGRASQVEWVDCSSSTRWTLCVPQGRGCKLWIASDGKLLQKYGECSVL